MSDETARLLRTLRVTEFLNREALLLDEWRLEEWLALFTEDAHYVVPGTDDADADPARSLVLIDDDRTRLGWRVQRLLGGHAHREFPWSRTRRLITNVIVRERAEGLESSSSQLLYHFRHGKADPFVGRMRHLLVERDGELRIAAKRVMLDQESLSPNGAVSMIL